MITRHSVFLLLVLCISSVVITSHAQDETRELLPVRTGGKWGYIDNTGEVVIQPQYDLGSPFRNGVAAVAFGRYSTDNPDSHIVSLGDKWGYIDKSGKFIWQPSK